MKIGIEVNATNNYYKYVRMDVVPNLIYKKEAKNLYYGRSFASNNKEVYNMILKECIKDKHTDDEIIAEIIKILLQVGYSIDELIVHIELRTKYIYTPKYNHSTGFILYDIIYSIYLYDPNSSEAKQPQNIPIPLVEANEIDYIQYKEYRKMFKNKNITAKKVNISNSTISATDPHNDINLMLEPSERYEPVAKYINAIDYFTNIVTDNTYESNSIVVSADM